MKRILPLFLMLLVHLISFAQVSINTDGSAANPSAMLDIKSNTAGILIPRMSSQDRDAISQPANGLLVYVNDDSSFYYYTGLTWEKLIHGNNDWINIGDSLLYSLQNFRVGIGTSNPKAMLEVAGHIWQTGIGSSVFIGEDAGKGDDFTKNYNAFIGYSAGKANSSGDYNTAIGSYTLFENSIGNHNTTIGSSSLLKNSTGNNNTAAGSKALKSNTIGSDNTAVGNQALNSNTTGSSSVGVGDFSLSLNTKASGLVAIGSYALSKNGSQAGCANTAINNTAVGYHSLSENAGGANNSALGYKSLNNNNGSANTGVGSFVMENMINGNSNTAMGTYAFRNAATGSSNVAIGISAMGDATGGDENIAIGASSLLKNQSGLGNIAIGNSSLYSNTTGQKNISIGENLNLNTSGNGNIAIGTYSLSSCQNGKFNIAMGDYALNNSQSGAYNIALGYEAGRGIADSNNIALGKRALYNAGGSNNIAIGQSALYSAGGQNFQIAIGDSTLYHNYGNRNNAFGHKVLFKNKSGDDNLAIGFLALTSNEFGNSNTAVGNYSLYNSEGSQNVAVGYQAGYSVGNSGTGNIFIGYQAGYNETGSDRLYISNSNTSTPLIGGSFYSSQVDINGTLKITGGNPANGKVLTSDANGVASWQNSQGAQHINDLTDGINNSFSLYMGTNSGISTTTGNYNTAIGNEAMKLNTTGERNCALGYTALNSNSSGSYNLSIGTQSLLHNISGNNNSALGIQAGLYSTGSGNVFIGYQAGYNETGNNKLYIANSNTTTPLIGGDFTTAQVDINGSLKITGGSPGTGKILTSDANGLASWQTPTIAVQVIDDLTDVDVSTVTPTNGQLLSWDGTNWVPANDQNSTYTAGSGLSLIGNVFSLNSGIDNLSDVDVSTNTPTNGQVLSWNGTNWVAADDQGAISVNGLSDGKNDNSSLFLGTNAGVSDDGTANKNSGFGNGALSLNTSGDENTAIGAYAMNANTTGAENVTLGSYSLYNNQTGNQNTAIGKGAGLNTTGSGNVFLGYRAGTNAIGSNQLYIANSATTTPLIGGDFSSSQLFFNGTIRITGGNPGTGKVLTSDASGFASWQTPAANAVQEINDLSDGITYGNSVFLGDSAGSSNGTLMGNTATGNYALHSNTSGVNNTVMGAGACVMLSSGDSNTVVGYLAGLYTSSGGPVSNLESSVLLGSNTRVLNSGDINEIVIGMGVTGLGSNSVVIGDANITKTALNGKVGIGTNSPQSALQVNGGVQVANDADAASASKVGTLRYRSDSNHSYVEMCVQTGASTYAWFIIHQETW